MRFVRPCGERSAGVTAQETSAYTGESLFLVDIDYVSAVKTHEQGTEFEGQG